MKEVQQKFFDSYAASKGKIDNPWKGSFGFTGPNAGKAKYYTQVEWFVGSFDAEVKWKVSRKDAKETVFDVEITATNVSGWRSATRLPKSWTTKIEDKLGVQINQVFSDGPRGGTMTQKLNNQIASMNAKIAQMRGGRFVPNVPSIPNGSLPSFGGNWKQVYQMQGQWTLKNK
jgi:hypothetical protein